MPPRRRAQLAIRAVEYGLPCDPPMKVNAHATEGTISRLAKDERLICVAKVLRCLRLGWVAPGRTQREHMRSTFHPAADVAIEAGHFRVAPGMDNHSLQQSGRQSLG